MHSSKKFPAAFLLVLLAAAAVLPLAASHGGRLGCHCPVRMQCCEDGTCMMDGGGSEPPATGPEWRTCRREAPATTALPFGALDRAMLESTEEDSERATGRISTIFPGRLGSAPAIPATPPPRLFSF